MKKKPSEEERIKSIIDALSNEKVMTSETEDAPNEDKDAHELEEKFRLGDSGDFNQAMQDSNTVDDHDPMGGESEDKSVPAKLASSKDVLHNPERKKLFRGGRNVMEIIIRGGR